MIAPTPGMVIKRRQVVLLRTISSIILKDSALLSKGSARDEHGAHNRFEVRRSGRGSRRGLQTGRQ